MILNVTDHKLKVKRKKCLIVGDIILDKYIYGDKSLLQETSILNINKKNYVLGGAANVAYNVKGYDLDVYLCGILGNDYCGNKIRELLNNNSIDFLGILSKSRKTTVKTRVICNDQQIIRIDEEDDYDLTSEEENNLLKKIEIGLNQVQIVIFSDYLKGVCTKKICEKVIFLCNRINIPILVDTKSIQWEKYYNATLITPNYREFELVFNSIKNSLNNNLSLKEAAIVLKNTYSIKNILITRDKDGMSFLNDKQQFITYSSVVSNIKDNVGAGDMVIATIAAIYLNNSSLDIAIELSNYAAGISCKVGRGRVTLEQILKYKNLEQTRVFQLEEGLEIIRKWRQDNEKIVFTNGCFDILHAGHINVLKEGKKYGDKLVVGLNTDKSIAHNKGKERPIISEKERAFILSELRVVDMVIMFNENTPYEILKKIQPDVLVKGADYKEKDVVGKEFAGQLKFVDYMNGYSTTNIIEKIRNCNNNEIKHKKSNNGEHRG